MHNFGKTHTFGKKHVHDCLSAPCASTKGCSQAREFEVISSHLERNIGVSMLIYSYFFPTFSLFSVHKPIQIKVGLNMFLRLECSLQIAKGQTDDKYHWHSSRVNLLGAGRPTIFIHVEPWIAMRFRAPREWKLTQRNFNQSLFR